MRIVRFEIDGKIHQGLLEGERIRVLDGAAGIGLCKLAEVKLLAPVTPSKVLAVGLNYRDHAEEMSLPIPEDPILFMKPPSSVVGPEAAIVTPPQSARVDYEAELAVVIGKSASKVSRDDAVDHIWGYTCLNDVTARDLQSKDGQWTRAKGFDTFCPIGPWIETEVDPRDLSVELYLNSELKQRSSTSNLIFDVYELVSFASHIMTLNPGDVIATGTPSGIGPMAPGDRVEVRIGGIGSLFNSVKGID